MTPRTRSGGAAPPSSTVYKSTPTLKQAHFPPRKTKVRTYGRRNRKLVADGEEEGDGGAGSRSAHTTPNLKQKTLTQYDFGSSLNEDSVVQLSDASDVENLDDRIDDTDDEAEKENIGPSSSRRSRSSTKKRAPLGRIIDRALAEDEGEARIPDTEDEDDQGGDESPVVRKRRRVVGFTDAERTKRRRTLGEEHRMSTMRESKSSRRRTLGDSPLAGPSKSRYHTQTLTQLMGRTTSFVADSDDEELGATENDGFLEWLGAEEPQSPSMGTQASKRGASAMAAAAAAAVPALPEEHSPSPRRRTRRKPAATLPEAQSREESVVPQTPVKSIRFDLPSSAQRISPSPSRLAAVYGAINPYASPSSRRPGRGSPLKPLAELTGKPTKRASPAKKPELVIEDSYATEGFSSVGGTQLRHATPSQTQTEVFSTPAEEMTTSTSAAAAPSTQADQDAGSGEQSLPELQPTQTQDGQNEQFYGALSQQIEQDDQAASQQPLPVTPKAAARSVAAAESTAAADEREIPDSDEGDSDFGGDSNDDDDGEEAEESRFAAGAETQLLMDQLQSSVRKWSGPPRAGNAPPSSSVASPQPPRTSSPVPSLGSAITPQSVPPSSMKPPPTAQPQKKKEKQQPGTVAHDIPAQHHGTPLRKPLHHPEPIDTQGLTLESQRVALATLQGFTPASARTDILLPLSGGTLTNLLSGHQDAVVLPFKVPAQVVRFWLIHDDVLRYLACVSAPPEDGPACSYDPKQDNGCGGRGTWTYHVGQVYELNNPVQEEDMRAEDWIHGQVTRYAYLPPAVVSQLLWNLRQALFAEPGAADEQDAAATPLAAAAAFSSSSPLQRSSKRSTPLRRSSRRAQQPSSPLYARPPASTMPAPPPPSRPSHASKNHTQPQPQPQLVRPSQATTASQASTTAADAAPPPPPPSVSRPTTRAGGADESSESLVFDDHGGSSIPMPYSSIVLSGLENLAASQLLTKSQTLPDSLMRDEEDEAAEMEDHEEQQLQERTANEIWDSEDE
ncbi:hypothetical protein PWT90_00977 [Aphanocladium album]|nr:hypothetical protein PWT90_00977 [Aphanocladium album]